jgi:hypothetical protein
MFLFWSVLHVAARVFMCVETRQGIWGVMFPSKGLPLKIGFDAWSPKTCFGNRLWWFFSKGSPLKTGFDVWPLKASRWKLDLMLGFQKRALKIGFDCFFSLWRLAFEIWLSQMGLEWYRPDGKKQKKGLRAARHNEAFSRQAHK